MEMIIRAAAAEMHGDIITHVRRTSIFIRHRQHPEVNEFFISEFRQRSAPSISPRYERSTAGKQKDLRRPSLSLSFSLTPLYFCVSLSFSLSIFQSISLSLKTVWNYPVLQHKGAYDLLSKNYTISLVVPVHINCVLKTWSVFYTAAQR